MPAMTTSSPSSGQASGPTGPLHIQYRPGMRLRITQQVPRQIDPLSSTVEGVVVRFGQQKTGSWYAHSKDHRLWLDRLELRKDDGELVVVNLDQYSHIEVVGE